MLCPKKYNYSQPKLETRLHLQKTSEVGKAYAPARILGKRNKWRMAVCNPETE